MFRNTAYKRIKNYLNKTDFDGVLVSRNDYFLREYYPAQAHCLKEATNGFTGSAGLALITRDKDILFVDSRYTIQAKNQTDFEVLEVPTVTTPAKWIEENMRGRKIGFNSWTHSIIWYQKMLEILDKISTKIVPLPIGLAEEWFENNDSTETESFDYDIRYAGKSVDEKCMQVAACLHDVNIDALVIVSPENVSWLLNERSKTVMEYPVVFERGIINVAGKYTNLNSNSVNQLKNKRIGLDFAQTPVALYEQLKFIASELVDISDPITDIKAVKNAIEIENIKKTCLYESLVICRFLAWIEQHKDEADEIMCDKKLRILRQENPDYFADSFATIAAVGEHAARAHYQADAQSNLPLTAAPLLLVDTGGHYMTGTTDMTRTIAVGEPTPMMKKRYTQVLQGHIDLAMSSIRVGESTAILDEKAHAWLRADGVDYYHGTGHGIGMMLGVHESPPIVHASDSYGLHAGMVFSNEPAYYNEALEFGIRLETMLLSVAQGYEMLGFENLLLIPFDARLIDFDILTNLQKQWLESYHYRIQEVILPLLNQTEQDIIRSLIKAFRYI